MRRETSTLTGVGVGTVIQIVLIILKLTNNITWSWKWVLAPTWISWSFVIGIIILFILFKIIMYLLKRRT